MRCLSPLLLLAILISVANSSRAGDAKADAELKALAERAAAAGVDADKLRQEIIAFRQAHPGTPQAVAAAGLWRDLPSALDKFDPAAIAPLEKFDWQPPELVAVLGEHRGRQGGPVTAVTYSRNGKMLASGASNGYVRFWDLSTMRLQHLLWQSLGNYALAFSKDNSFLAGGGGDGHVRLWDVTATVPKEKEPPLKVSSTPIFAVAVAPGSKTLAAGGSDTRVYLWDLVETPPREAATGDTHTAAVHAVAYSPDGKVLASGSADKSLRLWTVAKENRLVAKAIVPDAHAGTVYALAFHPTDNNVLITGGGDGLVRLWNLSGAKPVSKTSFKGPAGAVLGVTFSMSGKTIASAHGDGTCRTWTVGATAEKAAFAGHIDSATSVAFSPDGVTLVSGSNDWTVRQWPAAGMPKPKEKTIRDKTVTKGHLSHVYALAWAPDGKTLVSGAYDRSMRLWDMQPPEAKERLPNIKHDGQVWLVAYAPDGQSVAGCGVSNLIRTYNVKSRAEQHTFKGHSHHLGGLAYSPDGSLLASSSLDKTARLWNPKTGKDVLTWSDFEASVNGLAFAPDGKHLIVSSGQVLLDDKGRQVIKNGVYLYQDSTVRAWDLAKRKEVFRWKDEKLRPSGVSFTPDGSRFIVGTSDNYQRAWHWPEPKPGDPTLPYDSQYPHVTQLSFSPDGRRAAAFGSGGFMVLDAATGKRLKSWPLREQYGHITFAPDSRHVALSMGTGVIYLMRIDGPAKK